MKAARTTRVEREQRHETSVPSGANKISTSPPLGFCPSGAAACYRGFRNARTGDGGLAIRNPSCHSVDGTLISQGNQVRSIRNLCCRCAMPRGQAARSCSSSDEPRISTLRPFAVMAGASPFMVASPSAIRPSIVVAAHARQLRCRRPQGFQGFPLGRRQIVVEFFVHGASAFLQRSPQFLWRVIASAREIRATATSRYFDKRRCAVTSSCHWNRLNVSNHTDGRIKNAGAKLREYGARQKDRPIAATLKRKLLTKGKRVGRRNTLFSSSHQTSS